MLRPFVALAVVLQPSLALACGPTPPVFDGDPAAGVSVSVGRITDRTWEPQLIDGSPVPKDSGMDLAISFDGKVEGNTGCNRFTGTAEMDAGVLVFNTLTVTEMACADDAASSWEETFRSALADVRWFVVSPEGLWLMREDGSVAMCLK